MADIDGRTNDLSEQVHLYFSFADRLSEQKVNAAQTRAEFIRLQCNNVDTEQYFEHHRESWGIPKFDEGLVMDKDFKNGFLWIFRDHSTSWNEDGQARKWFFVHSESRFVRHYEFWACDKGHEEVLFKIDGGYKGIMWSLVRQHHDYSTLASPIFTNQELTEYYNNFDEKKGDYYKEELLEIIQENPNW